MLLALRDAATIINNLQLELVTAIVQINDYRDFFTMNDYRDFFTMNDYRDFFTMNDYRDFFTIVIVTLTIQAVSKDM